MLPTLVTYIVVRENRIVPVIIVPWLTKTQLLSQFLETDFCCPKFIVTILMSRRLDPDVKSVLRSATLGELSVV